MSRTTTSLEVAPLNIRDSEKSQSDVVQEDTFPDGGLRAWLVVLGGISANIAIGFGHAWGVFQAYYGSTLLSDRSPASVAWIGSIQLALFLMPATFAGRLFDLGYFRLPFFLGSMTLVASLFIIAECTEYWQLLLVHGFVVGIACGMCLGPSFAVVGQWFKEKRGTALSCVALGGPIGGTLFPFTTRQLIPKVGFSWTMRILGCIILVLMGFSVLTLKRRLPPKDVVGNLWNPKVLKSPAFATYCLSSLIMYLAIFTVLIFIDDSALSDGISPDFAFYFISFGNAGSLMGRSTSALLVDKIGAVNMSVPTTIISAVTCFLWPYARKESFLIAIALTNGFSTGTWFASFILPTYELGNMEDAGRRVGILLTASSVGMLFGPPIAGAIIDRTGGYTIAGYYVGSAILLSCSLALFTRHLYLRKLWGKF